MSAIILDRDGTLIDVVRDEETGTVHVAFHRSHVKFLSGVLDGLKLLRDAGCTFYIASNQPAPAKGQWSREAVERTNAALVERLAAEGIEILEVAVCMHHPQGGEGGDASLVGPCACRKPKPGLILDLIARHSLNPATTWMIGDSPGDVEAGRAAGVKTGLVFPMNRCELCPLRAGPKPSQGAAPTHVASDLLALARFITGA